jgi:hypothetical protein
MEKELSVHLGELGGGRRGNAPRLDVDREAPELDVDRKETTWSEATEGVSALATRVYG